MNITKENIDSLNAVVKVKVGPEDYKAKVDSALKEYTKKVTMPGFRPGKVPVGMIRKMYGKTILADELNKILNDSLHKYIQDNNIEILGNPLPSQSEELKIDLDAQNEYEFNYDLGLAPQFDLDLSKKEKVPYYVVKVDDELVNKYVTDLSRRYGKLMNPELSEEKDWLTGDMVELDANGEILPGGVFKSTSLFTERLKGSELKEALKGKKAEEKIILKPDFFSDKEDAEYFSKILGITDEKLKSTSFAFTIKTINRMEAAPVNQELFDKVYGPGNVNSEDEFRGKIREELSRMFSNDSDQKFRGQVKKALLGKLNLSLPDSFLKRWIMAVNDKPISEDQVDKEYGTYSEQLRWQLIENRILKEQQVKITNEEVQDYVKQLVLHEFNKMGRGDAPDEEVNGVVRNVLSKEDEVKKIYDQMYDQRLLAIYKQIFTLDEKELPYEEFVKQ
jgi:trigger factor